MKLKYIIIAGVVVLLGIIAGIYFYKESKVLATYQSPGGYYELLIKSKSGLFTSTMPEDGGMSMPIEAVLKDASGNTIGKSSDNRDYGVLRFSIDVFWDLENDQVWYGKAKTINIKIGKVEC